MEIPVFRPTIRRKSMNLVLTCLVSDRVGPGPVNRELASQLAAYLGLAGGYCFSSYREAILKALEALELKPGDGVVLSALAPAVYLETLKAGGYVPLVADVDPDSAVLTAAAAQELLGREAKAVIAHHTLGFVPDLAGLSRLGVPLIEDISQALGARYAGRACGSYGDLCLLSLEPEGLITAGEGGAVLAREGKALRNLRRLLEEEPHPDLLPDMNAALGVSQLKELDKYLAGRKEIAEVFLQALQKSRHKSLVQSQETENVPFSFPVVLKDGLRAVRQYAGRKNVQSLPAFASSLLARLDSQPPAAEGEAGGGKSPYPIAQSLLRRCLLFPLYPGLGRKNVELISKLLSSLP